MSERANKVDWSNFQLPAGCILKEEEQSFLIDRADDGCCPHVFCWKKDDCAIRETCFRKCDRHYWSQKGKKL